MAVTFVCGARCGIVAAGATPNPNQRHWDTQSGTAPTVATLLGKPWYRFNTTGAEASLRRTITGATQRTLHLEPYFAALPSADCALIAFGMVAGAIPQLKYRSATQDIAVILEVAYVPAPEANARYHGPGFAAHRAPGFRISGSMR